MNGSKLLISLTRRRFAHSCEVQRNKLIPAVRNLQNPAQSDVSWAEKIVYSSYLQQFQDKRSYKFRLRENALKGSVTAVERISKTLTSAPASWKYSDNEEYSSNVTKNVVEKQQDEKHFISPLHSKEETPVFPFQNVTNSEFIPGQNSFETNKIKNNFYQNEVEKLTKSGVDLVDVLDNNNVGNEDGLLPNEEMQETMQTECGTPDPTVRPSKVPCGGCGAWLHCQDSAVPGYLPSERFKLFKDRLNGELCLRCYCLKNYNTALNINISPDEYPIVMRQIDKHFAMVLLVVDLTDFPCSIWPGISDIIGTRRPVFLVGNKVDLIPRDSEKYLRRIEEALYVSAKQAGLHKAKIVHTALISAKTGFGVENLITKINTLWGTSGDIFIMGCTNVGKSSLFNTLIQSDLCKSKVVDLVQKATISQWPGTTLNLLKFPMLRPDAWTAATREQRLKRDMRIEWDELIEKNRMLRMTRDPKYAILTGKIGRTFLSSHAVDSISEPIIKKDPFLHNKQPPIFKQPRPGEWNPKDPALDGKWCYDTPGAVNENQILDILTLPELMKTLPKKLLEPRTFFIKLGMSLFIGGLARIDYIDGGRPIRYTIFCSDQIPITIVKNEDAEEFYKKALGTPILGIPEGNEERLTKFPALKPRNFAFDGQGNAHSCGDIVLSSAGWIGVTVGIGQTAKLKVHTPGGVGVFCRESSILPNSVRLKGPRIRGTFAYIPHRVFIPLPV